MKLETRLAVKWSLIWFAQILVPSVLLFFGPWIGLPPRNPGYRLIQLVVGGALLILIALVDLLAFRWERQVQRFVAEYRRRDA